jgi:spore coat polysaccharide biosynthesis predicted glycosyltransferase SpsG
MPVQPAQPGLGIEQRKHLAPAEVSLPEPLVDCPDEAEIVGIVDRPTLISVIRFALQQGARELLGVAPDERSHVLAFERVSRRAPRVLERGRREHLRVEAVRKPAVAGLSPDRAGCDRGVGEPWVATVKFQQLADYLRIDEWAVGRDPHDAIRRMLQQPSAKAVKNVLVGPAHAGEPGLGTELCDRVVALEARGKHDSPGQFRHPRQPLGDPQQSCSPGERLEHFSRQPRRAHPGLDERDGLHDQHASGAPAGRIPAARTPIVLVVDGGRRLGYGHAGRCLSICEELGGAAGFRVFDPELEDYLLRHHAPVVADQQRAAVVVIDRAQPTAAEEAERLNRAGSRVALVDDPGSARAVAQLVIDPPTAVDWSAVAGRRVGGFEHALIRREIRNATPDPGARADVLVSLGGSDPTGSTPTVLGALHGVGVEAKAICGPGYSGPPVDDRFRIAADRWPQALAGATLLITRFGHTLLEAAHRGVPAIALIANARDRDAASGFAGHGSARLGELDSPRAVAEAARALLEDEGALDAMARRGRELVDGRGAERVASVIRELVI